MNNISITTLIRLLSDQKISHITIGDNKKQVSGVNNPYDALKSDLVFIGEERLDYNEILLITKSEVVITSNEFSRELMELPYNDKAFIFVENPRYVFALIFNEFFDISVASFISKTSVISKYSLIGENVTIGEYVVIEDNCVVGDNCYIDSHVVIKQNTRLGTNVKLYPGVVIGSTGFGFIKFNNKITNFPHIAGVHIEDYAEIGSNTVIDRGSLTDTVVGAYTKIDNLCHIAHNVEIGKNCYIIANTMIGGSTKIGDNSWVAPSASLRDGLKIEENVTIGIGSVVTKNVPHGQTWTGSPAKPLDEFLKLNNKLKNL
jgi:UDP-3-O-[3-hydroxymyristoyl] glucosamine N-acyltransferase